jgi:uncharacterized membrane protein
MGYMGLLAIAVALSQGLGFSHLSAPSLWHDELIHAYVGKSIADTGQAQLPSGMPYHNGSTFNYILALMISLFGMTETALRSPSVLLAGLNVALVYFVIKPLLGRPAALATAFALALSPWTVAWSREARFYTLQQTLYLGSVGLFWVAATSPQRNRVIIGTSGAVAVYALGILTSFHSILFLGGIGAYAVLMAVLEKSWRSKWVWFTVGIGVVGLLTIASFTGLMNPLDKEAVVDRGGLGGQIVDPERAARQYYALWLRLNHSAGLYALAMVGFAAMMVKEKRKGLYVTLAFWIPILILTFFIGYRRPRFMFFAFPFYVAAFSYALVMIGTWLKTVATKPKAKSSPAERALAAVLVIFLLRLTWSGVQLVEDSLEVAQGADVTLARRHPQWKAPSAWVKERLEPDRVVLTTTYLPVLYYVGRVDNWYPTRALWWEVDESGMDDLKYLEDLQAYLKEHPKGYYLAEWWRFDKNLGPWLGGQFDRDVQWVHENMTLVEEASSEDVWVYAWDFTNSHVKP